MTAKRRKQKANLKPNNYIFMSGSRNNSVDEALDSWSNHQGLKSWWQSFFSSQLSVLTLMLVSVPPPCSDHSAKSTSGRLQLNTHAHYTCGFEWSDTINLCMVVWCTQNLHWDGSSIMWYQLNSSGYSKCAMESHSFAVTCDKWVQWVCLRAENSDI